jgi:hypothetical protein
VAVDTAQGFTLNGFTLNTVNYGILRKKDAE